MTRADSGIALMGRALTEERKTRHAFWKASNTQLLNGAGLEFTSTSNGECLCFRTAGKPAVDFYPSTGRWQVVHSRRMHSGGAKRFIDWYWEAR